MELGVIQNLLQRYARLEKSVASLIDDAESTPQDIVQRMIRFSLQTDLHQFDQFILEPTRFPDRHLMMQRLAPFFRAGVWLEQERGQWFMHIFFVSGECFDLRQTRPGPLPLRIPTMSPLEVNGAESSRILKPLGLSFLELPKDTDGFLFRPSPEVALILFSDTPPLWQEELIRKALTLINKAFTP